MIGDEPRLAYNRVLLSSVLAGETQSHDIELKPAGWWRDRGVTLKYGCRATEIDVGRRELKIANDESINFSRLVHGHRLDARCGSICPAPISPACIPFATPGMSICC